MLSHEWLVELIIILEHQQSLNTSSSTIIFLLYQVDEEAFEALIECISSGDFDICEQVPAGDDEGFLVNPVAGFAINLAGPAA